MTAPRSRRMGSTHATVNLEDLGGRTRMTLMSTFESEEQMEQMVQMGMEEGMKEAAGQIDAILAEHARACVRAGTAAGRKSTTAGRPAVVLFLCPLMLSRPG